MNMYKIFVKGIVQGVGFRPYIYKKAMEQGLVGSVKNIGHGVEIIINDKNFLNSLTDLPPLAKIIEHSIEKISSNKSYADFSIIKSSKSQGETILPPDLFMCDDCKKELKNKNNRRHNYYFITCTNCGPRFSMITDYPYDRPYTAMKDFPMCVQCENEYTNPLDRRYHAQTIACKKCGPLLQLKKNSKDITQKDDITTIKKACDILKTGNPLAIKGVGGFHLACLSDNDSVKKVRNLLKRPKKPFALMVKDIDMAKKYVNITTSEEKALTSPARPIVVVEKQNADDFAEVSELDSLGVMLAYTSLHYLLFDFIDEPLVMTSCNVPGTPVMIENGLGSYILTHERQIINRCDDSVVKVINNKPFYLRRSRGYVPVPVSLPIETKDTLALGAELSNVICATKGNKCFLSQHIGQTSKLETFDFLKEAVKTLSHFTRLKPEKIVCDIHPQYNSTLYAQELSNKLKIPLIQVQHHKAHVSAVAAEHGLTDYVGIAMDGLGYGDDGNIWGGEIFNVKNRTQFTRIGSLQELPQLGGDSAAMYPRKMLFGILSRFLDEKEIECLQLYSKEEIRIYRQQLNEKFNVMTTTSSGRILDASAALLNLCEKRLYDGRPAMLLESIATEPLGLKPKIINFNNRKIVDTVNLFNFLVNNLDKPKEKLAATVQHYIAEGVLSIAKKIDKPIVFSGGVAYNTYISTFMMKNNVLTHNNIPCGDGGICFGQAYMANLD